MFPRMTINLEMHVAHETHEAHEKYGAHGKHPNLHLELGHWPNRSGQKLLWIVADGQARQITIKRPR